MRWTDPRLPGPIESRFWCAFIRNRYVSQWLLSSEFVAASTTILRRSEVATTGHTFQATCSIIQVTPRYVRVALGGTGAQERAEFPVRTDVSAVQGAARRCGQPQRKVEQIWVAMVANLGEVGEFGHDADHAAI